ncbi:TonB-dependent receptor [Neokomagataea tanensis]|uniref:TonB-dependent receptor n=2 Tax=Neokomagataea TaxID=1223423 RepID=A0A4Y6V7C5_9PROT|nr:MULTISPECIES: TonB-dependent receptor [Neokomagataea]QDH24758.1 TonB-dependent receptor [Neokomagataea tanensis]
MSPFSVRARVLAATALTLCVVPSVHAEATQVDKNKQKSTVQADEQIVVKAARRNQMEVLSGGQLGALGNQKGIDTPFNIRSYTSALILNQQSQTLGQVLENDPSVRTTYGYGNFSEQFIIRGFPVYGDDVSINGLYGIVPRQLVSPQLYDQVQVLNGASAFLNGAAPGGSSLGGNINLIFKHATKEPIKRLTADYESSAMGGGALDVGQRFGKNQQFGLRFNASGKSGQTAIRDERRHSVALGLGADWHSLDNATRITVDADYENQGVRQGRPGVLLSSSLTSLPRVPSASHNYGQPWTYTNLRYFFGMVNVEHDFSKYLTAYAALGGLSGRERGDYSSLTVTNAATGAGTNGSMYVPYNQSNLSARAGVRAHFETWNIKHAVNAGWSGLWSAQDTAYAFALTSRSSNLYTPTYYAQSQPQTFIGGNVNDPQRNGYTRLNSIFFSDTLSALNGRIAVTGGFRYQKMLINSYGYGASFTQYTADAVTPVVGVVVHPIRNTSLYFNRIEGLSQGPQATGSVVNLGQVFPPYKTVQYEAGAKYDIGRFYTTLAFYQISKPNAYAVPYGSTGQSIFSVDGLQRNRGIEWTVNGEVMKGLRFNGGTSIIAAVQKRTAQGAYDGKRAIGVPGYNINGNIEYDLPFLKGATVTGQVIHTGHQWANNANTLRVPSWTRFDLGTRYTFLAERKPVTVRFGVENIANRSYWASSFGGYLLQGLPRTYKVSLTTDF